MLYHQRLVAGALGSVFHRSLVHLGPMDLITKMNALVLPSTASVYDLSVYDLSDEPLGVLARALVVGS